MPWRPELRVGEPNSCSGRVSRLFGKRNCTNRKIMVIFTYNLKIKTMKKLFCVVVTDVEYIIGLDSPIIFHIKCDDLNKAEEAVKEMLVDEYDFLEETVEQVDIFTFEVRDVDIIELD